MLSHLRPLTPPRLANAGIPQKGSQDLRLVHRCSPWLVDARACKLRLTPARLSRLRSIGAAQGVGNGARDWLPCIAKWKPSRAFCRSLNGSIPPRRCISDALEVGLLREPLVLDDLNPVSIRVQDECNVLHAAVGQPLLPVDVERLETGAGGVEVVDRDTWTELVRHFGLSCK
jgi:hypothetical protein